MQSPDARILWGAVTPTGLAGLVAIGVGVALAGSRGAIGAAIGTAVVIAFFAISLLVVTAAAKVSPMMMMQAALMSYVVKLFAMFGLIVLLRGVKIWDTKVFAWTVIALTIVWIAAEARTMLKAQFLYVEPGTTPPGVYTGDTTNTVKRDA